jgi:hypothetical protein
MVLGLTVAALVLGGIVLAGIAGYLIEKSPQAAAHLDDVQRDAGEDHNNP